MEERGRSKPKFRLLMLFCFCSGFFLSSIALYGGEGREHRRQPKEKDWELEVFVKFKKEAFPHRGKVPNGRKGD
jgi:hypothetical protein